ncbi:MAG: hypothetical protein WEG36_03640 [Gemmatimonadota bacterium]
MIWIAIVVALVGLLAVGFARSHHVFQYAYFLRFQILAGIIALAPLLVLDSDVALLLGNLLTLTPLQVFTTTVLAAFTAHSLAFSGEVAWENAEREHRLPFRKLPEDGRVPLGRIHYRPVAVLVRHGQTTALIAAVPLLVTVVWFSSTDGWSWLGESRGETRMDVSAPTMSAFALALGALVGLLVRRAWYPLRRRALFGAAFLWVAAIAIAVAVVVLYVHARVWPSPFIVNIGAVSAGIFVAWVARKGLEAWFADWLPKSIRFSSYLLIALTFYMGVYLLLAPDSGVPVLPTIAPAISALGYLLLLGILVLWVFAATALFLDRYRIPVILGVVLIALSLHQVFDADYLFSLVETERPDAPLLLPREAYDAWERTHGPGDHPVPVIVAASGGGVGASYWTTYVLTALQGELEGFGKSIVLISANSGGSLGSALYVEAFDEGEPPGPGEFEELRARSGTPTLAAVTWGLAFPDFLRTVSGGLFPGDTLRNRGSALELGWERARVLTDPNLTIDAWREDVREGRRPIAMFNGIVAPSGAKLVISPVDLDMGSVEGCGAGPMGFRQLYENADLHVRTAVRLSASAPWVLPLSRPAGHSRICHVGDGGYVDNTGVWSVVEFLRRVGPEAMGDRDGLVIVELRGLQWERDEGRPGRAWWWGTAGPVQALLRSSLTSQPARDDAELDLLARQWEAAGIPVERFAFTMQTVGPVFWGLTDDARTRIDGTWCTEPNRSELARLKSYWVRVHPALRDADPVPIGC